MKNIVLIICIALVSCKKENEIEPIQKGQTTQSVCTIDISLLKDVIWVAPSSQAFITNLKFTSSGDYYQGTQLNGKWNLTNGCDSIYVNRTIGSFYYRVISVTTDTLKLRNPVLGDVIYHK